MGFKKMKKTLLYLRVSSKEQELGFSLDAQRNEGVKYAVRMGLDIVRHWQVAESAKAQGRKSFSELFEYAIKNKDIGDILFEKTDRATRNYYDLIKLYELMEKHDKTIHFFKEGFIMDKFSKSQDKLRLDFQVVLAKNYINNLSEETKKGMNEKANSGTYPSVAPIGYLNDRETKKIVIDPKSSPLVKKAFELYSTGNYSLKKLINELYNNGLAIRKSGKKLSKGAMECILKNSIYYGTFKWNEKLYSGDHEPLITKDLFDRVQMAFKRFNKPKMTKRNFAFNGILTCHACGCAITAELKKKKYIYYRCTDSKAICTNVKYVREDHLADMFGVEIKRLEFDEENFAFIKDVLLESHQHEQEQHKETLDELQKQYKEIQEKIHKAYDDKLRGLITEAFWLMRSNTWQLELDDIKANIARFESADVKYLEEGNKILELSKHAYSLYKIQDMHEKAKLAQILSQNSTLDGTTLCFHYRKPFDILAQKGPRQVWLPGQDSNL